jgi:hypothetical protein
MNRLKKLVSATLVLTGFFAFAFFPAPASAADCGGVQTSFNYNCQGTNKNSAKNVQQTPIFAFLLALMNFMAFGVGIAVVGGIAWGSYNIISANGNAGKSEEGMNIIMNSLIGLLLFIFMYAAINFLVPGGLFT